MDALTGAAHPVGSASPRRHSPQFCKWGEPTLFLAHPLWLSAWDSPWSCSHPLHTGPLEATDTCMTCPDWAPPAGRPNG